MMSISGHKIYGPKGVGALILRPTNREFELKPILFGGDQEKHLRPGTLNVPGIVGLGAACAIAADGMVEECERLCRWQAEIFARLTASGAAMHINGPMKNRLCNNVNISFPDIQADEMILGLSGVAYSSGSACNSANPNPSHVLKAIGLSDEMARSTLRLGLGRFTSAEDVRTVTDKLLKMLGKPTSARAHVP